jgi:RHS repeat-associated protein
MWFGSSSDAIDQTFLSLSWTYNYQYVPGYAGSRSSIFGEKRTFTYGTSVVLPQGTQQPTAYVSRPNGQIIQFTKLGETWVPDAGRTEILTELTGASGWELLLPNGDTEQYSYGGQLTRLSTAAGRVATLTYTSAGLLGFVQDDQGRRLSFHYNSNSLVDYVVGADGKVTNFEYSSGVLSAVVYPDGARRTYLYSEVGYGPYSGALTGVLDEVGNRYSSTWYDSSGRAYRTGLAGGVDNFSIQFTTLNGKSRSVVTKPGGGQREALMQVSQGVVVSASFSDSCDGCIGRSSLYEYSGGVLQKVTSGGVVTEHQYSSELDEIVRIEAVGTSAERRVETDWDTDVRMPSARRVYGSDGTLLAKTELGYNSRGQLVSSSMLGEGLTSRVLTFGYCDQVDTEGCPILGLLKYKDGPRIGTADLINYEYYSADDAGCSGGSVPCAFRKGDLKKIIAPLGNAIEYLAYDAAGRPLSIKDTNSVITDYEYHPRGWLTAVKVRGTDDTSETDDRITRIDYWPTGLVKQITQPDGVFTAFTYDAAHRLTDIADSAGNALHYTLDNAGNRIKEDTKDAGGTLKRTLSRVYNQLGQLKTQATAVGDPTDFSYDANGNSTSVTDALGRKTQNEYDPLNRLSRTLQDIDGIQAETKFAYDALDNITQVTDPKGLQTHYEYNGFGDLVKLTSPDTGVTTYTYDSAGNRSSQTDARGVITAYTYDALNRLTQIAYPDPAEGLDISYTYDLVPSVCEAGETFLIGRLARMQDASGSTEYCYNRFGDLVRKVQTTNGKVLVLRYAYTSGGRLQQMTYPDGAIVDYVRNTQGQTMEVGVTPPGGSRQVLLTGASYYPFGPSAGWTYGNGRTLQRVYDQDYRPQAIQDTRPGGLEIGFGFDPVGNLTALTPAGNSTPDIALDYDTLGRLTAFKDGQTGSVIDGYTYDATGNRLSAQVNGTSQAYTYPGDSHRLSAVAGTARTYDASGNTTSVGGTARQYVYDATGRMSQARRSGSVTMNYRYNGRGEQVRRFLGSTNTYTLYDEAGQWLGDYDDNGAPLQQAIWLDDLPVGLLAADGQPYYIEPDHLGSPRVVIDPARDAAVWTWSLKGEAFGNTAPDQDPDGDGRAFVLGMRFPGQRFDAASGLNQNYFREYEAATGRYEQADPIGLRGGYSIFSYVKSSPLTSVDNDGLKVKVVTSDPVAARELMNAYARLNKSKRAREINRKLEESCDVYEIRPIDKDAFYCPPGATDAICQGRMRTVYVDPYNFLKLPTTQGMQPAPLEVVLGHELGHANGELDDGVNRMNNVIINENPIRKELGFPNRTSYTVPDIIWVPRR